MTTTDPAAGPLPAPVTPFDHVLHDFLVDLFEASPVSGTHAGYHAVDGAWPDLTEAGRLARLAMYERHATAAGALVEDDLSVGERTDRSIMLERIEELRFGDEVLRDEAWDPLSIVYLLGSGCFGLLAREYAPWAARGAAFASRVEGLPALLGAATAGLTGLPDRPVSLLHLETALSQLGGVGELVADGLTEARTRAAAGEAPELVARLEAALPAATAAIETFRTALDGDVRSRASGEGRLGGDLYARKLRLTLSSDLTPDELLDRAWRDHRAVRGEMLRLARDLWSRWVPDASMPDVAADDEDGETALVRRVLDAIAAEHQDPADLLDWCHAEIARIEDFCRERGVIGLTDEPLSIIWTPVFMRAYGRAFLDSPGPLDEGLQSHFFITPPADDATPESIESYMREDNDRMLRLLCIHEGVPGHYLQLARSSRSPSLMRTVFIDGMFAEGWAVYIEQVMMDLGYGADDPALMLTHWKFYLRAITNAILDVETHTRGLTRDGAIDLMVRQAFQEEDEADAKWLRARLTSTQLSTYYVGAVEMLDLEVEARVRAAVAAGGSAADVPAQRVVGDIGETPGFDYRTHLEAVIAHGTPPIRWVRRILAEETARA
ncbi:MAG: DUF885 domain-containing protein [Chloroflexi bacterium]|nr:DUF885 domain-containing protein [Chloroflexota bacterium]